MNARNVLRNFTVAAVAQATALLLSVVTNLLLPKVLGVEEFGYWQLFIFYVAYVGVLHLGLADGVYLIHGGESRGEIDKRLVASEFWFGAAYQSVFALCVLLIGVLGPFGEKRGFVIAMTSAFLLINNLGAFLGYTLQAMNETRLYSISVMIDRVSFLAPLGTLILLGVERVEPYVIGYACSRLCSLLYCAWKTRDFFAHRLLPLAQTARRARETIAAGGKLMVANLASMLIIGVARFTVDAAWGIEAFAQFSFALSLNNFFLQFIAQLAMVLFPALRQADVEEQRRFFALANDALSLLLPAAYVLYYPMSAVVVWWLPAYRDAVAYLAIVLPVCVFDSKMNILGSTFLKVLRQEAYLLKLNVCIVATSTAGVLVGVYLLHDIVVVMACVVLAIMLRSVVAERRVASAYAVEDGARPLVELAMACAFTAVSHLSRLQGLVTVLVLYAIYLFWQRERLKRLVTLLTSGGR